MRTERRIDARILEATQKNGPLGPFFFYYSDDVILLNN